MGVLAVVCITLSASLAASALSATRPSAACYLYTASTADSELSPGVCITLSASLPASARLTTARTLLYRHSQTSSQRPVPPIHLKICILTPYSECFRCTCAYCLSRRWRLTNYPIFILLPCFVKSASASNEMGDISCSGSILVFGSLCWRCYINDLSCGKR